MQFNPVLTNILHQYNTWYGEHFHKILDQIQYDTDILQVQIDSQSWFDQELTVYDDQKQAVLFKGRPLEWLGDHPQPAQMVELAWHAAALCDDDLPQPIQKLLVADDASCKAVVDFILGEDFNRLQADFEDLRSLAISRLLLTVGPIAKTLSSNASLTASWQRSNLTI